MKALLCHRALAPRSQVPSTNPRGRSSGGRLAFTLPEVLISMAVLTLLLLLVMGMLDVTQSSLRRSKERISEFRDARIAFELITRNLGQATLNTYWDYLYKSSGTNLPSRGSASEDDPLEQPSSYVRRSELHFIADYAEFLFAEQSDREESEFEELITVGHGCFFQAPLGDSDDYENLNSLLNARGYYVTFGDDAKSRPSFLDEESIPSSHRFRLMEYRPPSERNDEKEVLGNTVYVNSHWYLHELGRWSRPIADDVIAVFFSARTSTEDEVEGQPEPWSIAPEFHFNSREKRNRGTAEDSPETHHLLPPLVEVTMVAINEESARRLELIHGSEIPAVLQIKSGWFEKAEDFEKDLSDLRKQLSDGNVDYRILSMTVPIRAAKWSESLAPSPSPDDA